MSINKTSISAATRPNAVMQKFSNTSGKIRLKDGVIFHKFISLTEIRALWDKNSRESLRTQRQAYKAWLEDSLAIEYRLDNPNAIRSSNPNGLSGQKGIGMRATAAVAKAYEDLNVSDLLANGSIDRLALTSILVQARREVNELDRDATPENCIQIAKAYLVKCLVSELMPELPQMKRGALRFICDNLHNSEHCRDPDEFVIQGVKDLLWTIDLNGILALTQDSKLGILDFFVRERRTAASQSS